MNKKIVIINTGGTIAMSEDYKTKTVKPMDQATLDILIPNLNEYAQIEMDHFLNLPSPHITFAIMYELLLRTTKYLDQEDIMGVVITHGTDTLEETAYFLDLFLSTDKPVVVTGAMRSSNELGADGPLNLVNAVKVVTDKKSEGKGVLVVFNDEIHAAKYVTKTHTSNIATFQSPLYGSIGTISKKGIFFSHGTLTRENYQPVLPSKKIGLIKAAADMDDLIVNTYLNEEYDGIVIEALGQGNLPPNMLRGVKRATEMNIPIVLVSRCINGFADAVYGYEGGGKQLKEMGVIFANGLNGQKSRIKLCILLSLGIDNQKELQQLFDL